MVVCCCCLVDIFVERNFMTSRRATKLKNAKNVQLTAQQLHANAINCTRPQNTHGHYVLTETNFKKRPANHPVITLVRPNIFLVMFGDVWVVYV